MNFLNLLSLTFFLIVTSFATAQNDFSNEDWKALNSYLNEDYAASIAKCRSIISKLPDGIPKMRAQFILARGLMEQKKYDEAIELLSSLDFDATFLKSGIHGLIGDCKSDQGKYSEAFEFYKKAIHAEWNEGTTPMYLFKAFLCANELNKPEEGQQYIQSIIEYFPEYSEENQVSKYIIFDLNERIELTRPTYLQPAQLGIGTINGKQISKKKYDDAISAAQENARQSAAQMGTDIEPIDENFVWNSFIMTGLRNSQAAKLKIKTGENELMSYLLAKDGYEVQQDFLYAFSDERGQFQPDLLLARINELRNSTSPNEVQSWKKTREYYFEKIVFQKYHTFIGSTVFVSSLEVQRKLKDQQKYSIKYYIEGRSYGTEGELSIPDAFYEDAYERFSKSERFKHQENKRSLHVIEATIKPTVDDTKELFAELTKIKNAFKKTGNDSLFVMTSQSDIKFYTSGPYSTAIPKNHPKADEGKLLTFPSGMVKQFEMTPIGDVIIYRDENHGVIAKIIGRTDEKIEARHILIEPSHSEFYAKEYLKKVTNENFSKLAKQDSHDKGSSSKGGALGSFFFSDMVPSFATYCANAPIGEIGLVKSQFGYHIVQVTKRSGLSLPRLAFIRIPAGLSKATCDKMEQRLMTIRSEFISDKDDFNNLELAKLFENIAEDNQLYTDPMIIRDNAPRVFDFGSQILEDSLLKFAYNSKTIDGSVSNIFIDSNKMILALFEGKIARGTIDSLELYRAAMDEMFAQAEEEEMLEKIKQRSESDLQKRLKTATFSLENSEIPDILNSGTLVSKAIHAYENSKNGVYLKHNSEAIYIEISEKIDSDSTSNFKETRELLNNSRKYHFAYAISPFLLNSSTVIDNRDLYRIGARE